MCGRKVMGGDSGRGVKERVDERDESDRGYTTWWLVAWMLVSDKMLALAPPCVY
jgi:hypothetical protein